VLRRPSRSSPEVRRLPALGLALLALAAGCGDDDSDLSRARDFRAYSLYYLGDSFEGEKLTLAPKRYTNSFIYGDCEAESDAGCAPPIELQFKSICDLNPLYVRTNGRRDFAIPRGSGYFEIRGALAQTVDGTLLYTGRTTIKIYTDEEHSVRDIVASLRPVTGPANLGRDLPPPAFPQTMLRELRRRRSGDEADLKRGIAALPHVRSTPC
jgi:hypothetical protein